MCFKTPLLSSLVTLIQMRSNWSSALCPNWKNISSERLSTIQTLSASKTRANLSSLPVGGKKTSSPLSYPLRNALALQKRHALVQMRSKPSSQIPGCLPWWVTQNTIQKFLAGNTMNMKTNRMAKQIIGLFKPTSVSLTIWWWSTWTPILCQTSHV